jgi:GTPase SAR1 family protein
VRLVYRRKVKLTRRFKKLKAVWISALPIQALRHFVFALLLDPSLLQEMPFAQLVIGPPGSGKSTYCDGMHQFMSAIGRKCSVVNLDPANDRTSYPVALDVRDLVTLDEIMETEELGPNGSVLYALEELEHNFEWLEEGLKQLGGPQSGPTLFLDSC